MTIRVLAVLMSLFTIFGCTAKAELKEGGIYTTPQEDGRYTVLKILKTDAQGVHIRMYSNVFAEPPTKIDETALYLAGMNRKPNEALGMGHAPISKKSFSTWGAKFVQQSSVAELELEGYNMWLEAGGGYF